MPKFLSCEFRQCNWHGVSNFILQCVMLIFFFLERVIHFPHQVLLLADNISMMAPACLRAQIYFTSLIFSYPDSFFFSVPSRS
mmetsp:Transcript_70011/g.116683  ORF Transcript_70011/g.116683 Transcript_70011/m.116683 type:complete len:83 (-) Transcript_70011:314-562(-)